MKNKQYSNQYSHDPSDADYYMIVDETGVFGKRDLKDPIFGIGVTIVKNDSDYDKVSKIIASEINKERKERASKNNSKYRPISEVKFSKMNPVHRKRFVELARDIGNVESYGAYIDCSNQVPKWWITTDDAGVRYETILEIVSDDAFSNTDADNIFLILDDTYAIDDERGCRTIHRSAKRMDKTIIGCIQDDSYSGKYADYLQSNESTVGAEGYYARHKKDDRYSKIIGLKPGQLYNKKRKRLRRGDATGVTLKRYNTQSKFSDLKLFKKRRFKA